MNSIKFIAMLLVAAYVAIWCSVMPAYAAVDTLDLRHIGTLNRSLGALPTFLPGFMGKGDWLYGTGTEDCPHGTVYRFNSLDDTVKYCFEATEQILMGDRTRVADFNGDGINDYVSHSTNMLLSKRDSSYEVYPIPFSIHTGWYITDLDEDGKADMTWKEIRWGADTDPLQRVSQVDLGILRVARPTWATDYESLDFVIIASAGGSPFVIIEQKFASYWPKLLPSGRQAMQVFSYARLDREAVMRQDSVIMIDTNSIRRFVSNAQIDWDKQFTYSDGDFCVFNHAFGCRYIRNGHFILYNYMYLGETVDGLFNDPRIERPYFGCGVNSQGMFMYGANYPNYGTYIGFGRVDYYPSPPQVRTNLSFDDHELFMSVGGGVVEASTSSFNLCR